MVQKKEELLQLKKQSQESGFWQQKTSGLVQQRIAFLEELFNKFECLKKETVELKELSCLSFQGREEEELEQEVYSLEETFNNFLLQSRMTGQYDQRSAILIIQAGAGGRDAQDWACLLWRMYQRYCHTKGWAWQVLGQSFGEGGGPEGRIGLKQALAEIKGKFAYGLLQKESGAHRLVRLSPFSAKKLRHTSFAKVEVLPKLELNESQVEIKPDDLKIETFRASGPGGQNVNKRESAVRLTHLPTGLTASSQVSRLQGENRKIASQILSAKLSKLKENQQQAELKAVKKQKLLADFGHQIRSYVLHPYQLVKDLRTGQETNNVEAVLNGNLEPFVQAGLLSVDF